MGTSIAHIKTYTENVRVSLYSRGIILYSILTYTLFFFHKFHPDLSRFLKKGV
ncbi:hypothetical protein Bache_1736 [Bacteroides helcogenes P 36-108]|uniref:Uncharacterized protein n=1 Tax=Bacteroides helcogenes (strain ATCC 35417 / DSM 20613 / JCM 6297 / CCUG 15421 / P 36-108) TaxID=693979 RepID=E6SNI4_BACT6|nr:hypothetical protein Bache_1736 [Bacteroides helcogenes P 36-108]